MAASAYTSTIQELEAFCPSRPEPGEVTTFLDTLGFTWQQATQDTQQAAQRTHVA